MRKLLLGSSLPLQVVTAIGEFASEGCSSMTNSGSYAFYGCSGLCEVQYSGTAEQRDMIEIVSDNDYLINAKRIYTQSYTTDAAGNEKHMW